MTRSNMFRSLVGACLLVCLCLTKLIKKGVLWVVQPLPCVYLFKCFDWWKTS